ncbi:MAG: hypothetical protein NTW74_21355 [Acidobacteria bacterium]|nr:hypothetical protein [Acidobacteriota bacterium]
MISRRTLLQTGAASAALAQTAASKGTVTKSSFTSTKLFPGSVRDYWVY